MIKRQASPVRIEFKSLKGVRLVAVKDSSAAEHPCEHCALNKGSERDEACISSKCNTLGIHFVEVQ